MKKINLRRVLFIGVVFFLLLDLILLLIYLNNRRSDKKTAIKANILTLNKGEVIEFPPDYKKGVLPQYQMAGEVVGEPYFNSSDSKAYVRLQFKSKKSRVQEAVAQLGLSNNKISALFSDKKDRQNKKDAWNNKLVNEIFPFLKPKTSVSIRIPVESASLEKFEITDCDNLCRENINSINKFYKNNLKLAEIVREKIDLEESLDIGPVISIVIFTNGE